MIRYNPALKLRARELRKQGVLSEALLWNHLKGRKIQGFQFMRQKPVGDYIVDFYCSKLRVVIEIDGESHEGRLEYDMERQGVLESLGLTVLRFDDADVKRNVESVVTAIEGWIKERKLQPPVSPFSKGESQKELPPEKGELSQQGFALIAALLAVLVIAAVGVLILVVTTQDIRTSTRVVGEKKAFSAAEAGVHHALQNFAIGSNITNQQVDAATDPDSRFSYSITGTGKYSPAPPGYDLEKWSESIYDSTVTGENTRYGSRVQIDTGLAEFHGGTGAKTTD